MAKKSKTQKAKASVARAERKERNEALSAAAQDGEILNDSVDVDSKGSSKKPASDSATEKSAKSEKADKPAKEEKVKKPNFLKQVKMELKRVTWPTRIDVLRWSGVVFAALLFFGIYVAVLDDLIVSPLLIAYSGLGV